MKRQKLLAFGCGLLCFLGTQAQVTDEKAQRQAIIDELKREILDSIRKNPALLDKGAPAEVSAPAQAEPFSFGDFSWLNGNDRRHQSLLDSKYFTGTFMFDANYNYSNRNPIDHTVVGSTALARSNEIQVSDAVIGGEFHADNVRGKLLTQFGTRSTVVPRNDLSVYKGQYDLADVYRYISEAYGGYHFNALHGINVDMGMFMSYIGLFSYYNNENWAYQPSFTSDNTPWFFNGVRIQIFLSDRLKIEPWIINGWQSYGKFNSMPGFGGQVLWRPTESVELLSNNYFGTDVANLPSRKRFHTDNSFELRYFNRPESHGLSRAAFSVTGDLGFETGGGVVGFGGDSATPSQNFISGMVYNRFWFNRNKIGWTIGGGFIHNPGRYLVLAPTGAASPFPNPYNPTAPISPYAFTENPGDQFDGWDVSTTFDWLINDYVTWRVEFVNRHASVPYFAGHGGVTSPDGLTTTPVPAPGNGWAPDLVKSESRVIFAVLVRI
jgi:hypothetical protein